MAYRDDYTAEELQRALENQSGGRPVDSMPIGPLGGGAAPVGPQPTSVPPPPDTVGSDTPQPRPTPAPKPFQVPGVGTPFNSANAGSLGTGFVNLGQYFAANQGAAQGQLAGLLANRKTDSRDALTADQSYAAGIGSDNKKRAEALSEGGKQPSAFDVAMLGSVAKPMTDAYRSSLIPYFGQYQGYGGRPADKPSASGWDARTRSRRGGW